MDQPAGLLEKLESVHWFWSSWRSWIAVEKGEHTAWKRENPEALRAVNYIRELRKNAI